MLRPRLIPCLLLANNGLVKTINFSNRKYVGDPLNAVKIFNEKNVDELIVLDIDATAHNQEPRYDLIESLASVCRMPLCYGGGINNTDQALKILDLGVEKIALSSAAFAMPQLISDVAKKVGSQSVSIVIDVEVNHEKNTYKITTTNNTVSIEVGLTDALQRIESMGAGEIVINSVDRDGAMQGFDLNLIEMALNTVSLPITIIGGAGSPEHFLQVVKKFGVIGLGAGSYFIFKGKYRAVLINYPSAADKEKLFFGA
ncbi:AglZ/HisF2 family acetamidino modification protein [Polynucleobacter sp. AP-Feld-500C-C5]|uniref:AglZ/HisF2 family acetamidino modification protein n=1 Tax=Polynucleobacter sp. AP-Feld-500C-C5 TaxID=2576924 RepID=UPI001C0E29F3|nr:AglZ/HisF2 family acetamidino modification protein [Polynucleobacter sp. AP-Feld-500C-C5]MBU3632900.1 imidazole glycerol phosphate synthase subunit HisF [Polynucleobacter sp. AP-Feld-500C-C5]